MRIKFNLYDDKRNVFHVNRINLAKHRVAYFQLTERMKYIALIKVVSASVVIIITCFCIFGELPVYVTARLYAFGYMIGGFIQYIYHEKKRRK